MKRTKAQRQKISEATKEAMKNVPSEKMAVQKGKKWYKNIQTKEDGLFFECPEGWVPGRYARGYVGRFALNKKGSRQLTIEELKASSHGGERMLGAKLEFGAKLDYKCQHCGKRTVLKSEKITKDSAVLHHCLISKKDNDPNYYNFDDLWEEGHYLFLCESCHQKLHTTSKKKGGLGGIDGEKNGMFGHHWWNNGSENRASETCPGDGWVLGYCGRPKKEVIQKTPEEEIAYQLQCNRNKALGHLGKNTAKKGREYSNLWSWQIKETGEPIRKGMSWGGLSWYLLKKNNLVEKRRKQE
jgi:hypothetical protein